MGMKDGIVEPSPLPSPHRLIHWDVPLCWGKRADPLPGAARIWEGRATHVQNDQHWRPHRRGATEGQDESHGAPDPEANEDERDEDQFLISHGAVVLKPVRLGEDGPVLRERLVLCGYSREQR